MAPILGALFAILIGILAVRPYLDYQQQSFENVKAANTASQFRQLINATENYVQSCLPTTQSTSESDADSGTCPGFESLGAGQSYNIPLDSVISAMQAQGYLPQGTNGSNPYGQGWYINVLQLTSGNVQALLYSAGGRQIPPKVASEIAAETGQEAGFVPQNGEYGGSVASNTAEGSYGHWNVPIPQGISPEPEPGDLVALLDVGQNGVNNSQNVDYLYRRQVPGAPQLNTMQADLDMGGNNIKNAQTVQASAGPAMPALAEMLAVPKDANNSAEGIVQATGSNGDNGPVASMQADSNGASLTVSNSFVVGDTASPVVLAQMGTSGALGSMDPLQQGGMVQTNSPDLLNYINMQSDNNQSSLKVAGTLNPASENLTFISTPEAANTPCNPSGSTGSIQPGTLAPNSDGSGGPVICAADTTLQSSGSASTSYEWKLFGGTNDFQSTTEVTGWAGMVPIQNPLQRPMMITTNCQSESASSLDPLNPLPDVSDYDLDITVYDNLADALVGIGVEEAELYSQPAYPYANDPYEFNQYAGNPTPGVLSYTHTEVGDTGTYYLWDRPVPSLSAIIPPGKYFTYNFFAWNPFNPTRFSGPNPFGVPVGLPLGSPSLPIPCNFMVTD